MRLALCLLAFAVAPVGAQSVDTTATGDPVDLPPDTEPFEVDVFRSIYSWEAPLAVVPFQVVNDTAYPVYLGAAPALWAGAALAGGDLDPALRLAVSQGVNVAITAGLKRVINRPRPYAALIGVQARDRGHQGDEVFDPYSFPSGHTSSAYVIATSVSLSYPEWYVVVPAAAWAATMGVARIWHGVHYPSDVAVGAAIGIASATAVHFLMPDVFGDEAEAQPVRITIPL